MAPNCRIPLLQNMAKSIRNSPRTTPNHPQKTRHHTPRQRRHDTNLHSGHGVGKCAPRPPACGGGSFGSGLGWFGGCSGLVSKCGPPLHNPQRFPTGAPGDPWAFLGRPPGAPPCDFHDLAIHGSEQTARRHLLTRILPRALQISIPNLIFG